MIQIDEIYESFKKVVGWQQGNDKDTYLLKSLTESESGLCYQGAHPFITIENVASVMPSNYGDLIKEWQPDTAYQQGDKVKHDGNYFLCNEVNTNEEPPNVFDITANYSSDIWQPFNLVSLYIEEITKQAIKETIQSFVNNKIISRETKNIFEHKTLFDGAGRLIDTVQSQKKLVGFEIVPLRSLGVTTKIEKIGIQTKNENAIFLTLYLFHSSKIAPLWQKTFTIKPSKGNFNWFNIEDCYLPYISQDTNSGGAFYLCYDQNGLDVQNATAINFVRDWSREPCGTCNRGNLETYRLISKYLMISPFKTYAPSTFEQYPEMWDTPPIYTNTQNYGLNLELSIGCDLSDFMILQRANFATVIQKNVALKILKLLAYNPSVRVNRNQQNISQNSILYEIDGNTDGRQGGLKYEVEQAFKAIEIDTKNIDRVCLCEHNGGVKLRAI